MIKFLIITVCCIIVIWLLNRPTKNNLDKKSKIPVNKFKTTLPTDRNTEVNREEIDNGYSKDYNGNEIIHESSKPF